MNKKRKFQDKTIDLNKSDIKINFEDLSNEIIYEYLDMYHVYKSFFNLNNQFQHLLIKINILTMSKSTFEHYHNNIIIPNKHRINILRLSNPFTVDIVFSPPLTIHSIDYITNPTLFYIQIFRLPKLKFCQIIYKTKDNKQSSLVLSAERFSSIEYLIINT